MTAVKRERSQAADSLDPRERQFASLIWRQKQIGRREIHQLTGVHPNLTGQSVAALIENGLIRHGQAPDKLDRGRPQIPLEIDPDSRVFIGLSISPGTVRLTKVDPVGQPRGAERVIRVSRPSRMVEIAAEALAEAVEASVFEIGISFTGMVDASRKAIVFSSSLPSASAVSLTPLLKAAGKVPVVLDNDMHALALRWLLTSGARADDLLLVGLGDGSLGASVLIDGKPHQGSVHAANELGHMRLNIATDTCYCGQQGCLERIVSTAQLHRFGSESGRTLDEMMESPGADRAAVLRMLDLFNTGLANAVNFIRPQKVVIASPLVRHPLLCSSIRDQLPMRVLPGIRERMEILFWEQPNVQSAENAAWLALADVFGHSIDG